MANIRIAEKIQRYVLSEENYFQTLVAEGYKFNLLEDDELDKIQYDCLKLLEKKVSMYNGSESSSIRIEAAEAIMKSNLYTIGLWLKTFESPDDAVTEIKKESIFSIYEKGRQRINYMTEELKKFHASLKKNIIKTDNYFYNATVIDGIDGFFKIYSPEYEAYDIKITADYPLFCPVKDYKGIEFIDEYLKSISAENLFCKNFSEKEISRLLYSYRKDYKDLLINIYEIVLCSSIGSVIATGRTDSLTVSSENLNYLYSFFDGKNFEDIKKLAEMAFLKIYDEVEELDLFQKKYFSKSLEKAAKIIESGFKNKTLKKVFISDAVEKKEKTIVSFGEKMEDSKYREVIEEIIQCRSLTDKINIIVENIKALADFEDVLLDGEFENEEIVELLNLLSKDELETIRNKYSFSSSLEAADLRNSEYNLALILKKYEAK